MAVTEAVIPMKIIGGRYVRENTVNATSQAEMR
jgi:hypothetical protein